MTPFPDKLAIPEAAVEAAARAMAKVIGNRHGHAEDNWLSEARVEEARAALAAALPHMPDRGYAEVGELPDAVRVPLHSLTADIEYLFGRVAADGSCAPAMANSALDRLRQIEAAIRALAPPAPADNGAPDDDDIDGAMWLAGRTAFNKYAERYHLADSYEKTVVVSDIAPAEIYRAMLAARRAHPSVEPASDKLGKWMAAALDDPIVCAEMKADISAWFAAGQPLSATPSPIEDVAEPSEAEVEDARQEGYNEGYEEGKSEWRGVKAQLWNAMQHWLTLRHGLQEDGDDGGYTVNALLDGLAEVEAENKRLLLAARRVRPSPVDEDARDGVLEEAATLAEHMGRTMLPADFARAIRKLQSQRKG